MTKICPLVDGHECDIPDFLALVPDGKECCINGNCMRSVVPCLRELVAAGIGIVFGQHKSPTENDLTRVRSAIINAL